MSPVDRSSTRHQHALSVGYYNKQDTASSHHWALASLGSALLTGKSDFQNNLDWKD